MTMSSSRNKRKRAEADIPVAAPSLPRRRAREQRGSGTEPPDHPVAPKNDAKQNSGPEPSDAQVGEPSAPVNNETDPSSQPLNPAASAAAGNSASGPPEQMQDGRKQDADSGTAANKDSNATASAEDSKQQQSGGGAQTTTDEAGIGKISDKSTNASERGKSNRANQIRSMISHRKLLLERVRQGRSSAQHRVSDLAKSDPTSATTSESSTVGNSAASSEVSEKAKDDAEIAAFKRTSRAAMQAAKKQRAEKAEAAEVRTVSLRKGASVGKKMNAALSSLAPGHGNASGLLPADMPLNVLAGADSMSSIPGPPAPIAAQRPATTSNVRQAVHQPAPLTAGKRMKSSTQLAPNANQQSSLAPPNPKSAKGMSGARGMSSSSIPANAAPMPLHAGIPPMGLPPNRLATPVVVCPEAVALRERRNEIRSKLELHIKERQERIAEKHSPQSRPPGGSQAAADAARFPFPSSYLSIKGPGPASYLPRRRKTHWDNLLEEMRWMATDFIEERKWKVSAGRTLGSSVLSSSANAAAAHPVADIEEPEKADTDDKPSEEKASKSSKPSCKSIRGYVAPGTDDAIASRKVAKIISSMAYELGSATIDAGALAPSDRVHIKALKRHLGMRKELEKVKDDSENNSAERMDTTEHEQADSAETASTSPNGTNAKSDENETNQKLGSFERINNAVESLLEAPQKSVRKSSKRKVETGIKSDAEDVTLTSSQIEAIEFIEKRWGNGSRPGAIFTGPKSSGKTTALCSLLWKHRAKGPQLLVCSPARVMKWVHELYRFKGLHIRYLGLSGGISSPFSKIEGKVNFEANEIVVCEYSEFKGIEKEHFSHFETILIDCRYPRGFLGSRLPSAEAKKSVSAESLLDSPPTTTIPVELTMESWWENLTESVVKRSMNRVLVENAGPEMFSTCLVDKTQVQMLEIIALRAAFVMGPQIFSSPSSSVKKRILTWARRKTKEAAQSSSNKLEVVRNFLIESVRPFYCEAKSDGILEEASHNRGKKLEYEVRLCALSPDERSNYEKCCGALRGALSFHINEAEEGSVVQRKNFDAISDALLRMRRQCIHSKMSSLFVSAAMRARLGSYPVPGTSDASDSRVLCRKVNDNPSQTDLDLASAILEGSAKLRELVSILRNDCGHTLQGEEQLNSMLTPDNTRGRGKAAGDRPQKKVAILAVLPEMQILVSVLLNSIGIAHELLLRPSRAFKPSQNDISVTLPEKQTNAATLAWMECQQALSRFNSFASGRNSSRSVMVSDVLVTSPDTVAGDHGGIGIDAADFVISLDEDWSGRGELIIRSMMAGLILRNMRARDRGCQILRLVCENTCEEVFLSTEDSEVESKLIESPEADAWPWPLDSYGRFAIADLSTYTKDGDIMCWPPRKSNDEIFCFPGINVFRLRNESLSDVLSSDKGLPPLLNSGSPISFLPILDESQVKGEKRAEMRLLLNLMEREEKTHIGFKEAGIVSEHLSSFHPAAFTRQDLNVIAVRIYLEQFGKSLVLKHLSAGSGSHPSAVPADVILATSADSATAALDSGSGLPDSFQGGPVGKPDEFASSLLFYSPPKGALRSKKERQADPDDDTQMDPSSFGFASSRVNRYVAAFDELREGILRDGHQGSESLIYFPPLFPGLLQCSIQAKHDLEAIRAQNSAAQFTSHDGGKLTDPNLAHGKRPAENFVAPEAKRQKTESSMEWNAHAHPEQFNFPAASPLAAGPANAHQATGPGVVTEDEASHSDAASFLLGLGEDFGLTGVGAIPLPRDSAVASSQSFVEVSNITLDPDLLAFQSDLLPESIPCDAEELELFRKSMPSGLFLDSVVLFVARKKQSPFAPLPGVSAPAFRPPQGLPGTEAPWGSAPNSLPPSAPIQGGGNGVFHDINGSIHSSKKTKKKGVGPLGSSPAMARMPGGDSAGTAQNMSQLPLNMQTARAKEMYRNKILSFLTARQKAVGMTLFESPAYRVAAIRFRNRVNDRMPRHSWTSSTAWKVGPGLPLLLAKDTNFSEYSHAEPALWTSIVKGLKDGDSSTGDDAIALAGSQRSALRRSLAAPCRVDFGPFSSGFLPAPSGMTGVSPPRSRVGVTLPMGVKVPQLHGEQHQSMWSAEEDQKLQHLAVRYGMNWIVAASAMSKLDDDVVLSSKTGPVFNRSPRQCRDRWQALARGDRSLATAVRNAERDHRENALRRPFALPDAVGTAQRLRAPILATKEVHSIDPDKMSDSDDDHEQSASFILPVLDTSKDEAKEDTKMEIDQDPEDKPAGDNAKEAGPGDEQSNMEVEVTTGGSVPASEARPKSKSFGSLLGAKRKAQVIPITIPGVAPGSQQPAYSPAHPSHIQTVQSSVAASWTNGKTEMWPLQFLDVAEKQRAASAAAAAGTTLTPSQTSSVASRTPATSAVSRPQSSAASGGSTSAAASRGAHKPSASSRSSSSAKPRATPPHPKNPPTAAPYYPPYPHPHPGARPHQGGHPYPHPQHLPHQYQHQRPPPPASPAARPPNAAAHAKYAPAHTPVTHAQQLQAEAAKRKTPPSSAKSASGRPPSNKKASTPSPAAPGQALKRSPAPTPSPRAAYSPAPAPSPKPPPK